MSHNHNGFLEIAVPSGSDEDTGFPSKNHGRNGMVDNSHDWSTVRQRVEIYLTIQQGIYDHGWQRGMDSGDLLPNPETEAVLKAHARAMAEDAFRENFNPDDSLHDRSVQEEFEKNRGELADAKHALLNEKSKLKDAESRAIAAKSCAMEAPEFPIAIVVVAVPLITLTVAFTLFDSFVASLGFILSITFSLLAGLCWGAFISHLIVHKYNSNDAERNWTNWFGLLAGVGMAVGLGFIRFSQASIEYLWLVFGLTLLEVFIVLGLEFFARDYRRALYDHARHVAVANQAVGNAESVKAEIQRRQERVNELQNKVDEHLTYLDERELRAKQLEQFISSAEKAIVDGYRGAVVKNKGLHLK